MVQINATGVDVGFNECLHSPRVSFDIYEIVGGIAPDFFTIVMNFCPRRDNELTAECVPEHFSMTTGWSFTSQYEAYFFVYFMCSYCFKDVDSAVNVFDKSMVTTKQYDLHKDIPNGFENMLDGTPLVSKSLH